MRKQRRTQEEMDTLRGAIYAVAQVDRPVSIRHIFYRMVTQDLVEKSDLAYQRVQKISVDMRRAYWNTGYAGVGSFAEAAASIYRRDYWDSTDTLVEVWCESRSLAGVLGQVCREYVVPLFPGGRLLEPYLPSRSRQAYSRVRALECRHSLRGRLRSGRGVDRPEH